MTTLAILQQLKSSTFVDEDGEEHTLDFKPALTEEEIHILQTQFPSNRIPGELLEILRETKGWDGYGIEAVYFDSIGEFGFTALMPHTVTIGHDGTGNCWILEIKNNGELGKVYYACHDPAVLVIFADSLYAYIETVAAFYRNPGSNYLDEVQEKVVFDIWNTQPHITDIADFSASNPDMDSFLAQFTGQDWVVADLRHKSTGDGFAWGRFGGNQHIQKHPDELVWVIEKKKKGWLSKLLG